MRSLRKEIEAKAQSFADLNLNEVAALLMLSSVVKKLFAFAKGAEGLQGEEFISFCTENGVAVLRNNPFGAKEWSD